MVNFDDIKYERVDYDKTSSLINSQLKKLTNCNSLEEYLEVVKEIIAVQNHIEEMFDYVDINNMRDMENTFYSNEIEYWNEYKPRFDSLFLPFYSELLISRYKDELRKVFPSNFFRIIEYQARITSDEIVELVKRENELKTKYKLLNKTLLSFDGEEKTIAAMNGLFSHGDRAVRKKAHDVVNDFYFSKRDEYDSVLFELVNIRNKIARKLGFNNYVEYSLYKLKRFGYDYKDIAKFRSNIVKYIVPLCNLVDEWKKEELGIDELTYYDTVFFSDMPEIIVVGEDLLNCIRDSFKKVDAELYNLFNNMLDNGYIDVIQRNNKVNYAITNYLTETCMPCVTANYKNNHLDIRTTSHEMGHSFQKYNASIKDKEYIVSPLLKYPTFEVAEMFSYGMELIMLSYIDNMFDAEDYEKYCFIRIYDLLRNLPYILLVDEFQERLYSTIDLNLEDIRYIWKELVTKYNLERENSGHINLDNGGYFYRQSHIYLDPFYFIDYALSYIGAFSFWDKCSDNLKLFKEIGSVASYYSFRELIDKYNMPSPFEEEIIKELSMKLRKELENKRV